MIAARGNYLADVPPPTPQDPAPTPMATVLVDPLVRSMLNERTQHLQRVQFDRIDIAFTDRTRPPDDGRIAINVRVIPDSVKLS